MSQPVPAMFKARKVLLAGLGLVALLLAAYSVAGATATQETLATLSFTPPSAPLAAGEERTFVLGIANAQRLFGTDIELSFDPAVASVVDEDPAREGVQVAFGAFLDPGFVVFNLANQATGRVRVTYTQVAPEPPATGDGPLLSVRLKALSAGDPNLQVSAALLARDDGTQQPVILPSTGATPVPPQASPAPNPTEIPSTATAASAAPTVAASPTEAPAASATPAAEPTAQADADEAENESDDSPGWVLPVVVVVAVVLVAAGAIAARKYQKRKGVEQ